MQFSFKMMLSGTLLLLLVGCSSVLKEQTAKMDHYRSKLDQERLMTEKEREALYADTLWYNPALWQLNQQSVSAIKREQKQQDFFACVQAAEAIEKGISEQIGGIDPIQVTHARATIEVCMISKKYQAIDGKKALICESPESDVLPICTFSRDLILDYRGWG